jgi:glucose/mannose transport system substrate-binding protein
LRVPSRHSLLRPLIHAQASKPKVTVISQWSAGSDGAAITALGKEFEARGGIWEHNPIPGFTTEMMNKLRARIITGDPPAASQLKGPEIAAWSKIGAVVDLDAQAKDAGYEAVVPAELVRLSKPHGHWIALPIQAYRINTLFISRKAADQVGLTKLPVTWAEFNAVAEKMNAAGITPIANWRHQMGRRHEGRSRCAASASTPTARRGWNSIGRR